MTKQPLRFDPELPIYQPPGSGWGHANDLTLTLTLEERELLISVLTGQIERTDRTPDRDWFNELVQLRARIGGHL